jgi:WD40 repeat protein
VKAAISPNGTFLATAVDDGTTNIWSVAGGVLLHRLTSCWPRGHHHVPLVFSADERFLLTASSRTSVALWSTRLGEHLWVFTEHTDAVYSAEFSSNMMSVVTCSDDKAAMVIDTRTGALCYVLSGHGNSVISAKFSANCYWLLTASLDNTARIWSAHSGLCLFTLGEPCTGSYGLNMAEFSMDSNKVLTHSEKGEIPLQRGSVKVWNACTGTCIVALKCSLDFHTFVMQAKFSVDGTSVLTVARVNVKIWCSSSGICYRTIDGQKWFRDAVFSEDGKSLLTAGSEMKLWNISTGQLELIFKRPEVLVRSVQLIDMHQSQLSI